MWEIELDKGDQEHGKRDCYLKQGGQSRCP